MSDVFALVVVIGSVLTAVGVVSGSILWLVTPRISQWVIKVVDERTIPITKTLEETHRQVSINSHSSAQPTVLDRIDDVHTDLNKLRKEFINHLVTAASTASRMEERQERDEERLSKIEQAIVVNAEAQVSLWPAIEAVAKAQPPED